MLAQRYMYLVVVAEQVIKYHLQAIDELSIPDDSDMDNVDHLTTALPVASKTKIEILEYK